MNGLLKKIWRVDKKSIMIWDKFINMKFAKNVGIVRYLFKEMNLLNFVLKLKIL